MSNAPNSKYDWASYLPEMIRLYEAGWSIPDICKEIQDEAAGFTPSQRMVYTKFKSEGYSTEKIKREKFLKELNLSRQPRSKLLDPNSASRHPVLATPPVQPNEICDGASHLSTSGAHASAAHQTSTHSVGVPTNSGYLHGSRLSGEASHSDSFGGSNDFGPSDVSNDLDLVAMDCSDLFSSWTAELPQRQTSFDVQPSTSLEMEMEMEMESSAQNTQDAGSLSFNTQGRSNNDTISGYDGSQHNPQPWDIEFENVDVLHEYEVSANIKDDTTPQLPLSDQADGAMRDESLEMTNLTFHFPSSSPQTQTKAVSATLPEDHHTSEPASDGNRDGLTDTFSNSTDAQPRIPGSHLDHLDSGGPMVSSRKTPSPVETSALSGRMISWLKPKHRIYPRYMYNRSCTPEKRDSGYGSGRSSPMTPLVEEIRPHPRSLFEFKGLYRVPCQHLHEPQALNPFYIPKSETRERYRDIATCSNCLYSAIHNLSWSARHLKLEVFQTELRLEGIYDIAALDMTGNSALHYAASGGAGSKHLDALIQAGANPCQLNAAGQLFLHCLRPHINEANSENFDEDLVTAFNADLINLLNSFQHKGAFRCRDNDGRTVLDALASKITDEEVRAQTFRVVENLYPSEVSHQFPMTKSRSAHCPTNEADFATTQSRQDKAWRILGHASTEPSYVDPETGDNVLHALARLRLPERGSLLSKIQEYVLKDIDLNLHNRDRDCPLAAFISERPFLAEKNDETGATMSKYLDALLWKDSRRRIPNRINVTMRNREGATALYYAAIRGRPDSVRSLIEAGANVNARLDVGGQRISILQATMKAKAQAVHDKKEVKIHEFNNVISYLEHENAIAEPSLFEERAVRENSVRVMPL